MNHYVKTKRGNLRNKHSSAKRWQNNRRLKSVCAVILPFVEADLKQYNDNNNKIYSTTIMTTTCYMP